MKKFFIITSSFITIFIFLLNIYQNYTTTTAASSENINELKVPIIMYHSILNNPQKTGKYIITPTQLEKDLLCLLDNDYHTITTEELINYVYNNIELPTNPIILTFDDGYYNNYSYVYPLLKKYNMKAVISIIGIETDRYSQEGSILNNNFSHLTWSQVEELSNSGLVEILNHTYDMHSYKTRNGINKKDGESQETYERKLTENVLLLDKKLKHHIGKCNNTFTYPFGAAPKYAYSIIKELGFKATLSCTEGINYISHNPECLYLLKRINRASGLSSKDFFKKNGII